MFSGCRKAGPKFDPDIKRTVLFPDLIFMFTNTKKKSPAQYVRFRKRTFSTLRITTYIMNKLPFQKLDWF